MKNYIRSIKKMQIQREYLQGRICRNVQHKHIQATTPSCLDNKDMAELVDILKVVSRA